MGFKRLLKIVSVLAAVAVTLPAVAIRTMTDVRSEPVPYGVSAGWLSMACSHYGFSDCSAVEVRVYDSEDPWFPKLWAKKGVSGFYPYGKDAVFVRGDRIFLEKRTLESEITAYETFVHEYFHRVQSRTISSRAEVLAMESAFREAGEYGSGTEGSACRSAASYHETMSKLTRDGKEAVFEALSHGIDFAVSCRPIRDGLVALGALDEAQGRTPRTSIVSENAPGRDASWK